MSVADKIETLITNRIKASDCKYCFAVPGGHAMIDLVHPVTGRTVIYGKTLDECRKEQGNELAELMLVDDFCKAKAARQDAPIAWTETTEEKYWEMLEVLPPAGMKNGGFLVGEPWDHHATTGRPRYAAYKQVDDSFFVANRPITKEEFLKEFSS